MAGLILVVFVVGLDFVEHRQFRFAHWLIMAFVLAMVLMYKSLFPTEYESEIMSFSFDFSRNQRYKNLLDIVYLKSLVKYLAQHYWEAFLLMIPPIIVFFRTRRKWHLAYVVAAFGGYLLLIQVMYHAITMSRYMNQVYFPIVVISAIAFAYGLRWLPSYAHKLVAIVLVVLLVGRLNVLVRLSRDFKDDKLMMQNLTATAKLYGGSKFTVPMLAVEHDKIINAHWTFPIQTLLLSAIDEPDEAVTIHFDKHINGLKLTENEHVFRFQEVFADSSLNPKYFRLKPGFYKPLQADLPDSTLEIASWDKLGWKAMINYHLPKNKLVNEWITLDIPYSDTLYADINNQLFLSYHWFQDNDTVVWDGLRTTIEVDIYDERWQQLMIQTPSKPGTYTLEIDIVHEGVRWFGKGTRHEVIVR